MGDDDERMGYVYRQVSAAFRTVPVEKFNQAWGSDEMVRIVYDFLDNPDSEAIFFL